jgi:hypothetical protein
MLYIEKGINIEIHKVSIKYNLFNKIKNIINIYRLNVS